MTYVHHGAARLALAASILFTGVSAYAAMSEGLKLSGAQEVPPVSTSGTGSGSITVADDGTISGSIKTMGVPGMAAHIHTGAVGVNGPVIVALSKPDASFAVTSGACCRCSTEISKSPRADRQP